MSLSYTSSLERELYEAHKARQARYAAIGIREPKPKPPPKYPDGPDADEHVKRWLKFKAFCAKAERESASAHSVQRIINAVSKEYGILPMDLLSGRRETTQKRHIAVYLAKTTTSLSLPKIGKLLKYCDHSTIQYAVKKVETAMESSPLLRAKVEELRNIILSGSGKEPPCAS